jgi:hypothetical protein
MDLIWSVSGGNLSLFVANVDAASDTLTVTPVLNQSGSAEITLTLRDSSAQMATQEVTVEPVNDSPVVTQISDVNFPEDEGDGTLDLDIFVADVDNTNPELTWSATGNTNVTVSINTNSHIVTFGAAADWNGFEDITFRATDPGGLFDETGDSRNCISGKRPTIY